MRTIFLPALLLTAACSRAVTAPVVVSGPIAAIPVDSAYNRAISRGTRTDSGPPGARYWQQWASYRLSARLDPRAAQLTGEGTVRYHNRSPDTLRRVAVQLLQNLFASNAPKNENVPITGGLRLERVTVDGQQIAAGGDGGYEVAGTIGWIPLTRPLAPGDSVELGFTWGFRVPPGSAPRMGQDGEVFMIAQWYPRVAVYDDVNGWQTDPYLGNGEFYYGFGDYDVTLTVPTGWLVTATGELQNPREVLTDSAIARLERARTDTNVVHVVWRRDAERTRADADGLLEWRYRARGVRDFAWGTSNQWLWDATRAAVGDANGDGRPDTTQIHTLFRATAASWELSARFAKHSIEFLSRDIWPYPYPHMTAVETTVYGMEYPMLTAIAAVPDPQELYTVIAHEIAHMWFPMQIGSDEKRYAWYDEGLASYFETRAARDQFGPAAGDPAVTGFMNYLRAAGSDVEVPLMTHSDKFSTTASYVIASYEKPVAIFRALRGVIGDSAFTRAFTNHGRWWRNRHPTPQDLWNSFESASGRPLDWFWRTWFYETWTMDLAIAGGRVVGDSVEIDIERRQPAPMPAILLVKREGGQADRVTVPASTWLSGATRHTVRVVASPRVVSVELDPDKVFPDVMRGNDRWSP
ncbi:MAG TPA: M1 family metallopeptidase [Gemmatimonadaceae bacterium]|nr:M1 family metallopeptidase [Gemmatimonadaceae bacterium]